MEIFQGKMEIAVKYGADAAILLHNMVYWVEKNQANGVNFRDGRYWTYNTMEALCTMYPLWSRDQIKRLLKRCCELGLLHSAEYNKDRRDRTRWYSPSDEVMELYHVPRESKGRNRQMQSADLPAEDEADNIGRNRQMHMAESPCADGGIAPPLPSIDQEENNSTPYSPPAGDKPGRKKRDKTVPVWEPERFERFWALYPCGRDRVGAVREWDRLKPSAELIARMGRALLAQMRSPLWLEGKGIPYACRWLKNQRWEDKEKPMPGDIGADILPQIRQERAYHTEIVDGEEVVVFDDSFS